MKYLIMGLRYVTQVSHRGVAALKKVFRLRSNVSKKEKFAVGETYYSPKGTLLKYMGKTDRGFSYWEPVKTEGAVGFP